ncbi:MAG TPA: Hpt domain-containing protein [Propionibacteriaceae bacterium]|nr:Hpt domain-containing protein [Propionibacteriaceae bacterium]
MTDEQGRPDDVAEDRLRAAVESIGDHARSVNLARADRLSRALAQVARGRWEEAGRREAVEIAHQLVGSAGTFGLPAASRLAVEIERYFLEADLDDPVRLATAQDQVRRLHQELAAEPDYQPDDERDPTS